jgi:hypothetical protein
LLHARRLAKALALSSGQVVCRFRWEGLENRKLVAGSPMRQNMFKKCGLQPVVLSEVQTDLAEIDTALPMVVERATKRLFTAFEWAAVSLETTRTVVGELEKYVAERTLS